MGDVVTEGQPEETQEQPETPAEPEAKQEGAEAETGAPPEKPEARAEGEEAAEEEKPEEEQPKPEAKHERKGGFQRKIERQERELQQLRQQIAALAGGQQPQVPAQDAPPEQKAADYIAAMVKQQLEAEREQERKARQQAEFQRRTQEVRAARPDFDDVVESVSDMPVSPAVQQALLTSDQGPAIMYELAKSPAELARISALPPLDAAREIGRLEARLASGAAPQKPKATVRPPAPPTSVRGSSASTRSEEDLPISEYKRLLRSRGR